MAYTYSVNNTPANWSIAIFNFKQTAKTAGWTVPTSGDGNTIYSASSDVLTTTATTQPVNNAATNQKAWFVLAYPGGGRQFCIQRSTDPLSLGNNGSYRVKYSPAAGFTGGSPSATQTPSATDEVIIVGGGTDASPSFATFGFNQGQDGNSRVHMAFGDSTVGYAFYLAGIQYGGFGITACILMDHMQAGSYPSQDLDPTVIYQDNGGNAFGGDMRNYYAYAFMGSLAASNFVTVAAQPWLFDTPFSTSFPSGSGTNVWTGGEDVLPVPWSKANASPYGFKGYSSLMLWLSTPRATGNGQYDLMSVSSPGDHLCIYGALLPWPSGTNLQL